LEAVLAKPAKVGPRMIPAHIPNDNVNADLIGLCCPVQARQRFAKLAESVVNSQSFQDANRYGRGGVDAFTDALRF
jgi:hypothetical protein